MQDEIRRRIRELDGLTVAQLKIRYGELFKEPCRSSNRRHLFRRCAWRLQAIAEGGLSKRARQRARELTDEHGLRVGAPGRPREETSKRKTRRGVPGPGTVLVRVYKKQTIEVTVLDEGFTYEQKTYTSLSAVARAITGSRWSGHVFFGLTQRSKRA